MAALVLNPGYWLLASLAAAVLAAAGLVRKRKRAGALDRNSWAAAMHLHAGVLVGGMAIGHLVAVAVKQSKWSLSGSPPVLYLIGAALLAPSLALIWQAVKLLRAGDSGQCRIIAPNIWQIATLLALGPANLALAVPALLNIAYAYHTGEAVGRVLVWSLAVFSLVLLIGFLIFVSSGRSFMELLRLA